MSADLGKRELDRSCAEAFQGVESVALVDHPAHTNVGSHLIWLSTVLHLTQDLGARLVYASGVAGFSMADLRCSLGDGTIVLRGGYLGDRWHRIGKGSGRVPLFLNIIREFPENRVYLMPGSIHYQDPKALEDARRIVNEHRHLTIFARDCDAFSFASEHFDNCRTILSPDSVVHLAGHPLFQSPPTRPGPVLWLRRNDDWDVASRFSEQDLGIANIISTDWTSHFPDTDPSPGFEPLAALPFSRLHRLSWSAAVAGIEQIARCPLLITNRLHGHISALLLGIPHIVLPGPYRKTEAYYETWSAEHRTCELVRFPAEMPAAIDKLRTFVPHANASTLLP